MSKNTLRFDKHYNSRIQKESSCSGSIYDRTDYRSIAKETLRILDLSRYQTSKGVVYLSLDNSVRGTRIYSQPVKFTSRDYETNFEVFQQPTLFGAKYLTDKKQSVAVLNFASAKNPGGGFIKGSNAQEESLARASGLYVCLRTKKASVMYQSNVQDSKNMLYQDMMIYSPEVPVFRDSEENLLEEPYFVSFISAPAVNKVHAINHHSVQVIEYTMKFRIRTLLSVAASNGYTSLVLGAWGCGVFGNDSKDVAS